MSQPPQPPQPPGPPPGQQPGGQPQYGTPPAGQPGQPVPGTPPQQPWAQPGYGYPQQQPAPPGPNPYAQQPPVGYGFPPPAQPTVPIGGQSPGARSNRRLIGAIAGIVAAVLVVGGGVWALASGGGSKATAGASGGPSGSASAQTSGPPHNPNGQVAWSVPAPTVSQAQRMALVPGLWFNGGNVVKQSPTAVTAYDIATGTQRWQVPAPANYTCNASQQVGNKVALQYGPGCANLMVVDTAAGRMLWHQSLPNPTSGDYAEGYSVIAVSGSTLAVGTPGLNTFAYDVATGKGLWSLRNGDECAVDGYAGGPELIKVYRCGWDKTTEHVARVDPATGQALWTWDAPAGTSVISVLSTNPVVLGITAGHSEGLTDIWDIDGGRLRSQVSLGNGSGRYGKYAVTCPMEPLPPCNNVLVSGNTLYLATNANPTGPQHKYINEIHAFDLTTGHGRPLATGLNEVMLVAADGPSVIAYDPTSETRAGRVLKVDKSTGAVSVYTTFSDATRQKERDAGASGITYTELGWYQDTLVLSLRSKTASVKWKYLITALR